MRVPSSTPAPGPKFVTLPKPSSAWLLEHRFASEIFDSRGEKVPGIGVSRIPDPQEAAYIENVGHAPPPAFEPGTVGHAQWTYKRSKNGPSAADLAVAA